MSKRMVAYDEHGKKVATLDFLVAHDADGRVIGVVDFEAHDKAGGKLREIWNVDGAVRSKVEKPRKRPAPGPGTPAHLPIRRPE